MRGRGDRSSKPSALIAKPSKESARDRHHSLDELREIWTAASELGYPFGSLVRLLIVLPMRREELAAMPTAELDLGMDDVGEGVWTLPAERTKRANALRVPLPPLARTLIKEAIADNRRSRKVPLSSARRRRLPFLALPRPRGGLTGWLR